MGAYSAAPPGGSGDGGYHKDAKGIGSNERETESVNPFFPIDPVRDWGRDPVAYWRNRYPDPIRRETALNAIIEDALQKPIVPSALYMQFVGGRADGMRLIKRTAARIAGARYAVIPITDADAIALVGHGRYFEPFHSIDPPLIWRCFPMRAVPSKTLQPLNGIVRRLREPGAR